MNKQVKHFFVLTTLGIFFVVRWLFTTIRNLIWWWNGTSAAVRQRQNNWQSTAQHAHKMKILFSYSKIPFLPIDERNFLMTHDGYVEPEYVLRDDITLLSSRCQLNLF